MPEKIKVFEPKRLRVTHGDHSGVYRTKGWQQLRKAALQRDLWTCQMCGKLLFGKDATVDHTRELQEGGAALPGLNGVQSLCLSCNARKGRRTQGDIRR